MSLLCGFLSLGVFLLSFTPLVFASFRMRGRRKICSCTGSDKGEGEEENTDARSKTKIKTRKITELWHEAA